jgi:hypothetical protein
MRLRAILREPLVHFLALGGLLFLFYLHGNGGLGAGANRIAVSAGQVAALRASFEKLWLRAPSPHELNALVEDFIREEIATREATARGLQEGDVVIRRRLRQKLEFLLEDELAVAPPTDAELQAWLEAHPTDYLVQPVVSFRQVYLNSDRRGVSARGDAEAVLGKLRAGADPHAVGDPTLLPAETGPSEVRDVAIRFGEEFASAVAGIEPGPWTGPVQSTYGLHLVQVVKKTPGRSPDLALVRDQVSRDLLVSRRAAGVDSLYRVLRERYRITIDSMAPPAP